MPVLVRALTIGATLLAMGACSVEKPMYYHQVEGEARFSGAIEDTSELSPGYTDYGAATYTGDHISIHTNTGNARVLAKASGVKAPGKYALESVWVERIASEQPGLPFECKLTCDPCDLTIVEVNENAIAGTLRCDGLKTCTEPTLPSEALEGSLCGQLTTHLLDVSVDFRFTEPSAKRKDY